MCADHERWSRSFSVIEVARESTGLSFLYGGVDRRRNVVIRTGERGNGVF